MKRRFLAASLFSQDLNYALLMFVVIAAFGQLLIALSTGSLFLTIIPGVQGIVGSIFFYLYSLRLLRKFNQPVEFSIRVLFVITVVNLFSWILSHILILVSIFDVPEQYISIIAALSLCILFYIAKFYFYYIDLIANNSSITKCIDISSKLYTFPRRSAFEIIAIGLVISTFLEQILSLFQLTTGISEAAYWTIISYLCFADIISINAKNVASKLPHQSTLWIFGSKGLGTIILTILVLSGLNIYQLITSPPTFQVSVAESTYIPSTKEIKVKLKISSDPDSLTKFQPLLFKIAGENGYQLSSLPTSFDPKESLESLLNGAKSENFTLTFIAISRTDDLDQLNDTFLWYGTFKIAKIKIKKIIET